MPFISKTWEHRLRSCLNACRWVFVSDMWNNYKYTVWTVLWKFTGDFNFQYTCNIILIRYVAIDDNEGMRTVNPIPNKNGIVKFEIKRVFTDDRQVV
jgi:hypothetical protein